MPCWAAQPLPGLRLLQANGARALQEVAAKRRHVAELLRGRPPQRFREGRILGDDLRIGRDVAHPRECAEYKLAASAGIDAIQLLEPGNIDHFDRRLDIQLHQIVKRGATGQEARPRLAARNGANGVLRGARPRICEGLHS